MQPLHTRLLCRASTRLTPPTALWQHFIAPTQSLYLQPPQRSSFTTGTERDSTQRDGGSANPNATDGPTRHEAVDGKEERQEASGEKTAPPLKIRKPTTVKGLWHPSKKEASLAKSTRIKNETRERSNEEAARLLRDAKAAFELGEDYDGVVVRPKLHPGPMIESLLPWCLPEDQRTMSGVDRLAIEIGRYYDFAKLSQHERIARHHVIEQLRRIVRSVLPQYVLEVFGSERMGIALATSDIDLRLVRKSQLSNPALEGAPSLHHRQKDLRDLNTLLRQGFLGHPNYILAVLRHAHYPLISLQDRDSGLDVQIVLTGDTSASRAAMRDYMVEYPYLLQLYSVVKTTFDVRGLSDVFRGGFGSYTIFMMIVASLRHHPHPRNDAAGGLINFLKFWHDFDTHTQGVSIEPVYLFDKASEFIMSTKVQKRLQAGKTKPLPAYMMCLRDPANKTNDLGRKAIAIKHVQATFKYILKGLEKDVRVNTRASLLGPLLGASYRMYEERRLRVKLSGKRTQGKIQAELARKAKAIRDAESAELVQGIEGDQSEELDDALDADFTAERIVDGEESEHVGREQNVWMWQKLADKRTEKIRLDAEQPVAEATITSAEESEKTDAPWIGEDAESQSEPTMDGEWSSILETPADRKQDSQSS